MCPQPGTQARGLTAQGRLEPLDSNRGFLVGAGRRWRRIDLPETEQDAIAALILEQVADDQAWDESFARSQDALARLARRAREDVASGRVHALKPRVR